MNNQVFFKGTNVTLLATASDLDGVVTRVEFFASTNKIGEDTNAPFSVTWSNVPFGAFALTAKATDDSAAVTTSGAVNVQVVSNQLPTISFVSPTNGQSFLRPTNILLSAQASDADGTIRFVEFLDGTNFLVRLTNTPYSFTWSNVVLGSHSLMARAADNWAGTNQTTITIAVSNRPPQVALNQPTNNQVFFAGTNVTLLATASDLDGVVTRVEFYEGANKIGEDTNAPFSVTWSNVPFGAFALTAKATDDLGDVTTSVAVSVQVVSNQLPTISFLSPTNGQSFLRPANILLSAQASDSDGTVQFV